MGQAKKRRDATKAPSLKDRRKSTVLGTGCVVGDSLVTAITEAVISADKIQYQENKARAKVDKRKKRVNKNWESDYYAEIKQEKESKKKYGSCSFGVTYKHHSNIQKLNKKGR